MQPIHCVSHWLSFPTHSVIKALRRRPLPSSSPLAVTQSPFFFVVFLIKSLQFSRHISARASECDFSVRAIGGKHVQGSVISILVKSVPHSISTGGGAPKGKVIA